MVGYELRAMRTLRKSVKFAENSASTITTLAERANNPTVS
jgi:hypothetical protein